MSDVPLCSIAVAEQLVAEDLEDLEMVTDLGRCERIGGICHNHVYVITNSYYMVFVFVSNLPPAIHTKIPSNRSSGFKE
jgi:hypothetical protein